MRKFQFVSYLVLYFWGGVANAGEPDYFSAYLSAEISKCELRNLQSYWKQPSEADTKIAIGKKVLEKKELLGDIVSARKQALQAGQPDCDFWSLDFSYSDAETMASYWGTDTYDAKLKIAQEVAASSQQSVKKMLKGNQTAAPAVVASPAPVGGNPIGVFYEQGYHYCHAKMVGKAYGVDTYETKSWLGGMLQQGNKGLVDQKLAFARESAQRNPNNACYFSETDFTSKDAEKLAEMWKMSYEEAKVTLANKYVYGMEMDMMRSLR